MERYQIQNQIDPRASLNAPSKVKECTKFLTRRILGKNTQAQPKFENLNFLKNSRLPRDGIDDGFHFRPRFLGSCLCTRTLINYTKKLTCICVRHTGMSRNYMTHDFISLLCTTYASADQKKLVQPFFVWEIHKFLSSKILTRMTEKI
jgi:hypothetical protein